MNSLPAGPNRRILVIDDNRAIHDDFRKILAPTNAAFAALGATETALFGQPAEGVALAPFEIDSAYQGQEGLDLVNRALTSGRPYALAFVDVRMPPGWDGVETTQKIWAPAPDIQIVLCTAYSDYAWDELTKKLGQHDGLLILKKPFDAMEALQLAHALTEKWRLHQQAGQKMAELESRVAERTDELQHSNQALQLEVSEHKRVAIALRASEQRFRSYFELGLIGMAITSPAKTCLEVNDEFCRILGYDRSAVLQMDWTAFTHPDDLAADLANFNRIMAGDANSYSMDKRFVKKNGDIVHAAMSVSCVRRADGSIDYFLALVQDITVRKHLETHLIQSQKLETVGRLAGGVAHEFNNLLTAILGQSEILMEELPAGSLMAESATEINKAAGRAAILTRQLLAYGRKQLLLPAIIDLNKVLTDMAGTLRHLMGRADVRIVPAAGLHTVRADVGQLEQVIMNLALNAADAMPNGGKLTLETANVSFDQERADRYPELKPGDYVVLAMTDTGMGMSPEVKARLFEPFFTTKGVGQGTGLGLSTCYGIIKQSGGHISVYSEPARGTTFKIYLPQSASPTPPGTPPQKTPALRRGTETVLLVEDDPILREMATTLLRRLGYTVFAAADGIEALGLKQQRDIGHIDLLFTDVVMPHMSGKELAGRIRTLFPHTRTLFTSAYAENAVVHQGILDPGVAFLQKPFTPATLAAKLREVLDPS
jgi:two-component system cell cycle sensor histidine kinase/response regulator CckA